MTDFASYAPDQFDAEALSTINKEKAQWDNAVLEDMDGGQTFMREIIKQGRRYYDGRFDAPYDEVTQEKKTWVPMTKWSVESVVKAIDLDTKDILILPGNPSAVHITPIVKAAIENLMDKLEFGQLLNDLTRVMAMDGTVVVKSTYVKDHMGKKQIASYIVDLMNLWIDPTVGSLQDSPVIERSIMDQFTVEQYKGAWENVDAVSYSQTLSRVYDMLYAVNTGSTPYTEIWERWGPIRKSWLTKEQSDHDTWVEGHMIASGIGSASVVHLIRKNPRKDGRKPYEECWYRRLPRRWYGEGVAEMLFDMQEYVNMVVNIRKANNMVLQNGIFLIRRGSGITPDMLSTISAGGGLPVSNINTDIKQLTVQDFRQSSYTDEDRAYSMADRVTSSFDINRGEVGRASASATATLTRDRNIRDTFVLVQEGIGFFIERLILKQYIPLLQETTTDKDLIKITGEPDFLSAIDERIIKNRTNDFILQKQQKTGFYPDPSVIDEFKQEQLSYLKGMGKQRFVKYFKEMFDAEVDVKVHVTDEKFNRVVAIQFLKDALIAFSRLPVGTKLNADAVFREMFDLMGLKGEFFLEKAQIPSLAGDASQIGRQMKEIPGMPSEMQADMTANQTQQTVAPEQLRSNLDINTELSGLMG